MSNTVTITANVDDGGEVSTSVIERLTVTSDVTSENNVAAETSNATVLSVIDIQEQPKIIADVVAGGAGPQGVPGPTGPIGPQGIPGPLSAMNSLAAQGETPLIGDVTISEGLGIQLVQTGQDIEIAAASVAIVVGDVPPAEPADGALWGDTDEDVPYSSIAQEVGHILFPIGAIYSATVATNPATLLGFGTWVAFGEGKVMVGKAPSGTFATAGATGGAETHLLTAAESGVPAHTHPVSIKFGSGAGAIYGGLDRVGDSPNSQTANANTPASAASAHNNLQPYIVVYMWTRTA